jgi:hypothetical protein
MAKSTNSQVRANVWVTPDQVDQIRTAILQASADYLAERNDAMIALLYDAGLIPEHALERSRRALSLTLEQSQSGTSSKKPPSKPTCARTNWTGPAATQPTSGPMHSGTVSPTE